MKGQTVVCPVTLRRKEIQEWGQEYWWVSRNLMTARKIALVQWVRTWKRTVANDRAGIKHPALKLQGPLGLGGMNKGWKNELLKEHCPKNWMCSSHVVIVCYRCWSQSRRVSEEGRTRERYITFYIAWGKSPGQNGIIHSHWTKYINSKPQQQNDSCTK